jgi:molecular chaperone HtpG
MQKGHIGVTSDNIFPIIKKFLYSDHEIFLREIVSNAVDATQKLKTLASVGEFNNEIGDTTIHISINKKAGTLTVSDKGVGMTEEEINKYINQIAFSGAEEFVKKYKDNAQAIIGHFGLGFYSTFMVSKKVEIKTLSYQEGAKAVQWSCEGNPEFEMKEIKKAERGTDIILYIDDENKEFLEESKISFLLNKYCKFLPVPIAFGKETEWKDGKQVETDKDKIINDTEPAWTKKPSELKKEDYDKFYHELYPTGGEQPLFYIHLNVDYPFNLTGILYFPKIKNNIEIQRNKIQLYSNQVFVTDSVEGIVPEYLTLLHGVIDSPDIPLNVSRSYLQSDGNVKKISGYITKKVAERLLEIFKEDRSKFEEKWDSLKLFIQYGMLSDEKFYERAEKFALLKNVDGKYFTLEEYKKLISGNQTDKDGNLIYLYANNADEQYSYLESAKAKGYDILLMDGQLDVHIISQMEQKNEKSRFVRIDSDIIEKIIQKDIASTHSLSAEQQNALTTVFRSQLPAMEKTEFIVTFESIGDARPIIITQNEFMRRMKDMSAMYGGNGGMMSFYGEMPATYNLVINTTHPLIENILKDEEKAVKKDIAPIMSEISEKEKQHATLKKTHEGKKDEEIPTAEKSEIETLQKQIDELNGKKEAVISDYAKDNKQVRQLIDLALLANNMLRGEALNDFVKRSIDLM